MASWNQLCLRAILLLFATVALASADGTRKLRIVLLDVKSFREAAATGAFSLDTGRESFQLTADLLHREILSSAFSESPQQKEIVSQYFEIVNGFSVLLTDDEVDALKEDDRVLSVTDNKFIPLSTTRSYTFLGLDNKQTGIWRKTKGGNIIVGVLDSGVWPENPSYSDKGLGAIPKKFKGVCSKGEDPYGFKCNKKLIGARYLGAGYSAESGKSLRSLVRACGDYLSPRDVNGHGTHTSSTAVGSATNVKLGGRYVGTAKGVAVNARLSFYKVFWCEAGATTSDLLTALNIGVADGVDLFSLSLGGSPDLPNSVASDPTYYTVWKATLAGIPVVYAAGNDGPYWYTLENTPPWVMTVAASNVDRRFNTRVVLGNGKSISGPFVVGPGTPGYASKKQHPIIAAGKAALSDDPAAINDAQYCFAGSLSPSKVKGKIVVCIYNYDDPSVTARVVGTAGGVGAILYLPAGADPNDVAILKFTFPAVVVSNAAGVLLRKYLASTSSPKGYILPTNGQFGKAYAEAPNVAKFSSTGPNAGAFSILKPDITAPGVNIIASWPNPSGKTPWNAISGTSMATPHVAGAVALIRAIHPTWRPSMIFSAIMTTATQTTNRNRFIRRYNGVVASPFSKGAGHLNVNSALFPGLVYPISNAGYRAFLCSSESGLSKASSLFNKRLYCGSTYPSTRAVDLNIPSVVFLRARAKTVSKTKRTLKNVASTTGTYTVSVKSPTGSSLRVSPTKLYFGKGATKSYSISINPSRASKSVKGATVTKWVPQYETVTYKGTFYWTFGTITWSDGKGHKVRINVALNAI